MDWLEALPGRLLRPVHRHPVIAVLAASLLLTTVLLLAVVLVIIPFLRACGDTPSQLLHAYQSYDQSVQQQLGQQLQQPGSAP